MAIKTSALLKRQKQLIIAFQQGFGFHVGVFVYWYCDFPRYDNVGCRSKMKTEAARLQGTFVSHLPDETVSKP
jgi:hypothetical protein